MRAIGCVSHSLPYLSNVTFADSKVSKLTAFWISGGIVYFLVGDKKGRGRVRYKLDDLILRNKLQDYSPQHCQVLLHLISPDKRWKYLREVPKSSRSNSTLIPKYEWWYCQCKKCRDWIRLFRGQMSCDDRGGRNENCLLRGESNEMSK